MRVPMGTPIYLHAAAMLEPGNDCVGTVRGPLLARQHTVGLIAVGEALGGRLPLQWLVDLHGDLRYQASAARAMSNLGVGSRYGAVLDRGQPVEVVVVIGTFVQVHFVRPKAFVQDARIARIQNLETRLARRRS